jgi:hypothetical protein
MFVSLFKESQHLILKLHFIIIYNQLKLKFNNFKEILLRLF